MRKRGGAARLEEEFGVELLARVPFDVDLGDGFRGRALAALSGVPFGETVTYGGLAELAGFPKAARAAGVAKVIGLAAIPESKFLYTLPEVDQVIKDFTCWRDLMR